MAAKPFTDKANANAQAIQAATDYLTAQLQAKSRLQQAHTKIAGQLQDAHLDAKGQAAEAAMKAQHAAGQPTTPPEDVVGPQIQGVPLPQVGQASQNIPGQTLSIDPSQVSGGGGIQQASGINGGGGGADATGGYNVPPTITSQSQTQGTNWQQTAPGNFIGLPQDQTTTRTIQNVMTPYQLGELQNYQDRSGLIGLAKQQQANDKLKASLSAGLAGAIWSLGRGYITKDQLNSALSGAQDVLSQNGMGPGDFKDVLGRADVGSIKADTEGQQKDFASMESVGKLIDEQKRYQTGSREWNALQGRIDKLNTPTLKPLTDLLFKPTYMKMETEAKQLTEAQSLNDNLISVAQSHPEYFGAKGSLSRAATKGLGALTDIASLVGGEASVRQVYTNAVQKLNDIRGDLQTNGNWNADEAKAYGEMMQQLSPTVNSERLVGTIDSFTNALAVNLSSGALNRVTIQGIREFKNDFLNLTGAESGETAMGKLLALKQILQARDANLNVSFKSRNLPRPQFQPTALPEGSLNQPHNPMPARTNRPTPGVPIIDPSLLK